MKMLLYLSSPVSSVVSQLIIGCLPGLDNFFVTLFLGDQTTAEVLCDLVNGMPARLQSASACLAGTVISEMDTVMAARVEILVANRLDIIQGDLCGLGCSMDIDNLLQNLL